MKESFGWRQEYDDGYDCARSLANDGKVDTLLKIFVADNVAAAADRVERIDVRVLLSDPEAEAITWPVLSYHYQQSKPSL